MVTKWANVWIISLVKGVVSLVLSDGSEVVVGRAHILSLAIGATIAQRRN